MCFIVLSINVFYYNNNYDLLTQDLKQKLIFLFIFLICVNILLEITNVVFGTLEILGWINSGNYWFDLTVKKPSAKAEIKKDKISLGRNKKSLFPKNKKGKQYSRV